MRAKFHLNVGVQRELSVLSKNFLYYFWAETADLRLKQTHRSLDGHENPRSCPRAAKGTKLGERTPEMIEGLGNA